MTRFKLKYVVKVSGKGNTDTKCDEICTKGVGDGQKSVFTLAQAMKMAKAYSKEFPDGYTYTVHPLLEVRARYVAGKKEIGTVCDR